MTETIIIGDKSIDKSSLTPIKFEKSLDKDINETKRIIREGEGNAPEIRPFSMIAMEE